MSIKKEHLVTFLLALIILCSTILSLYNKFDVESLKTVFMAVITIVSAWLGIEVGYRLALRK